MTMQRIELGTGTQNRVTAAGIRALLDQVGTALERGRGLHFVPANEGRYFCGGFDLNDLARQPRPAVRAAFADFLKLGRMVFNAPIPVLAEAHGHAVGIGAMLVMAADTGLMTPHAKLRFPEVTLGLALFDDTVAMIRHRLSGSLTERLVLHGEALTAQECHALGLVRWISADPLIPDALEQWRAQTPDAASRAMIKRLCRTGVLVGEIEAQLDRFMDGWDRSMHRRG